MDGPAPAILNAIEDATGVRFCAIRSCRKICLTLWDRSLPSWMFLL